MLAVGRMKEKGGERRRDYLAYLTVRMPSGGYITIKLVKGDVGLCARVGIVGRVGEPPKFGPRPHCWEVLKGFLTSPGIVVVEGNTYVIRRLLAEAGFAFDKKARVYRRGLIQEEVDESEPADFYEELGF